MFVKGFDNLEEMEKYYNKDTNTYVFKENGEYIDLVIFHFDLHVGSNIDAYNINAWNINVLGIVARNINAWDITACGIIAWDITAYSIIAGNITAKNISYDAICGALGNIKCKSIKGRRKNSKHFVLDGGTLEVEEENQ